MSDKIYLVMQDGTSIDKPSIGKYEEGRAAFNSPIRGIRGKTTKRKDLSLMGRPHRNNTSCYMTSRGTVKDASGCC